MRRMIAGIGLAALWAVGSSCALAAIQGGPLPREGLVDGVYRGSAWSGPVRAVVDVVVEDQRIRDVVLVHHNTWWGRRAEEPIPRAIVEQQSTRVDAVSGATISSTAIMNAAQEAVAKASR